MPEKIFTYLSMGKINLAKNFKIFQDKASNRGL